MSKKTRKKLLIIIICIMSQVAAVLDVMGEASAKAQGLKTAITSGKVIFKNFLSLKNMKKMQLARVLTSLWHYLCFL